MICNKLEACMKHELAGGKSSFCNISCIESSDKRSEVKCEEKRKKYILQNTTKNHVISSSISDSIEDSNFPTLYAANVA